MPQIEGFFLHLKCLFDEVRETLPINGISKRDSNYGILIHAQISKDVTQIETIIRVIGI